MSKPKTVAEFFNPHNIEHIQAYNHLCKTGAWPPEFWIQISGLESPPLTVAEITSKLALEWVKYKMSQVPAKWDQDEYSKPHQD